MADEKLLVRLFHRAFGVIVIVSNEPRERIIESFFPDSAGNPDLVRVVGRDEFDSEVELIFCRDREVDFAGLSIGRVASGKVLPGMIVQQPPQAAPPQFRR